MPDTLEAQVKSLLSPESNLITKVSQEVKLFILFLNSVGNGLGRAEG